MLPVAILKCLSKKICDIALPDTLVIKVEKGKQVDKKLNGKEMKIERNGCCILEEDNHKHQQQNKNKNMNQGIGNANDHCLMNILVLFRNL